MKALATSRSARLSAGAVLALAAALLAPPRAAAAGCGPRGLYHADVPAAARDNAPLPAPPKPKPCSGPHCSASLPLPLPPPTAPPVPPGSDLWGLPAGTAAVTTPAAERFRFEPAPDHPVPQALSVYRPPR